MRPRASTVLAALLATGLWACAGACVPALAQGEISFAPCEQSNDFACAHLVVPLDRTGALPGTITLAIRRHRAAVGEERSAIIALAGGPGQPALPFLEQFDEVLGPIAATRDVIVFDERGIGLSDPLSCHAFESPRQYHSRGALVGACGDQLGPQRSFYTTADSVADIEAIRVAGGYEKLVLYGTSYGTKLAEQYAQAYPSHVEALVLDSVVGPAGPEPLNRSTFAAIPRILRQLCVQRLCANITANPVADLFKLVRRMQRTTLRGRAIGENGSAHTVVLTPDQLLEVLLAGDFSSLLRSEFLTALAAAARGDTAPLARLARVVAQVEAQSEAAEEFDNPVFYATSCEEQALPFNREASPPVRVAEAEAAARALGARAFAPFSAANALETSVIPECAHWPYTTPAPLIDEAPLPNVPTLILSGADDLRTPTANAREVAAQIPDAHLEIVPYTGHSVLSAEPGSCASEALQALFANTPVKACARGPVPAALRPPPLPPERLALVSPQRGYQGTAGRTLHALALTLLDLSRQLAIGLTVGGSAEAASSGHLRVGGLRAGWGEFTGDSLQLHAYSYVPGVTVSGEISAEAEQLSVGGTASAHGVLHRGPHRSLIGTLGGRSVVLPASAIATAAIVGSDVQQSSHRGAGDSAQRGLAGALAALLGRL